MYLVQSQRSRYFTSNFQNFSEHVSLSDEGPLLERLEFFAVNHGSYQPLKFSCYLTVYAVSFLNIIDWIFHKTDFSEPTKFIAKIFLDNFS